MHRIRHQPATTDQGDQSKEGLDHCPKRESPLRNQSGAGAMGPLAWAIVAFMLRDGRMSDPNRRLFTAKDTWPWTTSSS